MARSPKEEEGVLVSKKVFPAILAALLLAVGPASAASDPVALRGLIVSQLAPLQLALRSTHSTTFGMWIDASGQVTVAVVGDDPGALSLVQSTSIAAPVSIKAARWSEADLNAVHDSIRRTAGSEFGHRWRPARRD